MKLNEILNEAKMSDTVNYQAAWDRIIHNESTPGDSDLIANSPKYSYDYAKHYIKGRWSKGEPAILTSSWWSFNYATNVLKERWLEAEPKIFEDILYGATYINSLQIKYPECKELAQQVLQDPIIIKEAVIYHNFCKQYFSNNTVMMNKWLRYGENMRDMS
jgi:hypothetical protein